MTEDGLNRILKQATDMHPDTRWIGAVLDDGRISVIGIKDGLTASDRAGNGTTPVEAISNVVARLNYMVAR